jgi:hypothetical protein
MKIKFKWFHFISHLYNFDDNVWYSKNIFSIFFAIYSYIVSILSSDEKFKMVLYYNYNNHLCKLDILIIIYSIKSDINFMY